MKVGGPNKGRGRPRCAEQVRAAARRGRRTAFYSAGENNILRSDIVIKISSDEGGKLFCCIEGNVR